MEDAEYVVVIMGSAAGTTKDAVDHLREQGIKAGLIKIRVFRPFPGEELAEALKNAKFITIMDRAESFSGCGGPVGSELKAALLDAGVTATTLNYFYGIGGRDYAVSDALGVYQDMIDIDAGNGAPEQFKYIGLRK
jgi:pyruvate ferredoxin oxidoreductase alpha subunit